MSGEALTAMSEAQRTVLASVLDMIVPASSDGRMPSAADINVADYIQEHASQLLPTICAELDRLEADADALHGKGFVALSKADREALVDHIRAKEPLFLASLAIQTVTAYYQNDRVLKAIGMEARAPFPEGYTVVSGDLSLLDPVRKRGRIYRDAP